jgi:protoporphyrinogen IX oxidase
MGFEYFKAVHIIFIVTWFAGLFYMPRLFVYIIETHTKPEPEKSILLSQLKMMSSRLWYGITWPSAVITLAVGISMVVKQPFWLQFSFMHIKLGLVVLLYGYHISIQIIFNQLSRDTVRFTSQQMRMWNEVATLFLISIVFLIVVKTALSIAWGLAGLAVITLLILAGIKLYKKFRKNEKPKN